MKEMKDISNIIKIDLLEIDYTLSYFENKPYLFILFIYPEGYEINRTNPTIRFIETISKDYNFNILKDNCDIPEYIETIVRNNFFITDIEKGITTATITLIDTQLDLSSLYSQSETTINVVKEDNSITKITEYYSENGKINILVEQHISIEEVENYGDVYTYTVMLEDAIANEDYENAAKYSELRELAISKNN